MKSLGTYISKYLASFTAFVLGLLFFNAAIFGMTFYKTFTVDYGEFSPRAMLEMTASAASPTGIPQETAQKLRGNDIWAFYLNQDGKCLWSLDLPEEVQESYTIGDVALFSKGYLADYPVFVRITDDGLLVLGYPKGSYTKLTSNYYPTQALRLLPLFAIGIFIVDLFLLFLVYYFSKRKIFKNTAPIVDGIFALSNGNPVSLHVQGELSEIADSVNKTSELLSRQNEARANWISGVSHDIRTPLSMIMGYTDRIAGDMSVSASIRAQAEIVRGQSIKIRELVQDLNLVSQLEYEMQPLSKEPVRLSKLIRSYAAELLNTGISDAYEIEVEIASATENTVLECDTRLIQRAVNNLVQNSIRHNPQGCEIRLILEDANNTVSLTVADNGKGLLPEKLRELREKPHYMESTDERLDLRHGLGLLIVRQIVEAHSGRLKIEGAPSQGCRIALIFPAVPNNTS